MQCLGQAASGHQKMSKRRVRRGDRLRWGTSARSDADGALPCHGNRGQALVCRRPNLASELHLQPGQTQDFRQGYTNNRF